MLKPLKPFKPLKPAEGYGSYEFDDVNELVAGFIEPALNDGKEIIVEPKWDGIRLVVHYDGERSAAYTEDRQRDRMPILPALDSEIQRLFNNKSVILDGELLLGRYVDGKFMPVMRPDMMKVVVGKEPIDEPMKYFAFDVLYYDGEDFTSRPFKERRELLERLLKEVDSDVVELTPQQIVASSDEALPAIEWAVSVVGSEGAVVKISDAIYELDGRTTAWAKYKRWKAIKCQIIGISKVFPPNTEPENWKEAFRQSRTYIFRCAVLAPDGKTLIPIEAKRTLTESDFKLRYVRAGEEDPVTGKVATKSEWKGRDARELWEMDERFGHRDPGEFAYGQTYAIKVDGGKPSIGQIVEVAPIALNWFVDDDGYVHLTWMHPRVISVGTDEIGDLASWERIVELILASGQEPPEVEIKDGKLKLKDAELKSFNAELQFAFAGDGSEEEEAEVIIGTPEKPLPRMFPHTIGVGLSKPVVVAAARCIPEHKRYVELFAGTSPLLRAKPQNTSEEEIILDIDRDVVAWLRALKSGRWRKLKSYNWRPTKRQFNKLSAELREGKAKGIRRLYAWVYTTFYGEAGYSGHHGISMLWQVGGIRHRDWKVEIERLWNRCELWQQRLRNVKILRMDAFDAIRKFDGVNTFFFADPPWEFDASESFYQKEFDHDKFMELCSQVKGKILVLALPGRLNEWRERNFTVRRLNYETGKLSYFPVAEEHGEGISEVRAKRRIYFVANYELPQLRKLAASSALSDEGEELTHEEQRKLEEEKFGDSFMVVHDVDKYQDGYAGVYMRHFRGLWSEMETVIIKRIVGDIIRAKSSDDRTEYWQKLRRQFNAVILLDEFEKIAEEAQKISDERKDVSGYLSKMSTDDLNKALERLDSIKELSSRVVNFASVHGDLRIQNPASPKTQLIGFTIMTPAVAVQFVNGEIIPVLRDKFLYWQEGDRMVAVKKARQPIVWLDVVNPKEPILWSPPSSAGATENAWALFQWHAFMRVWFGVQRPDYHELFVKFDDVADDDYTTPEGKWVFRLLEGKGEKIGKEGVFWQFWYPEREGQVPYVISHTPSQAKKEWQKRKYDYIILNLPVVDLILSHFADIEELIDSKDKYRERLENLDQWAELEIVP